MKLFRIEKFISLLVISLVILCSCGTPYQPEEEKSEEEKADQTEQEDEIADSDEVPSDGTLETVTWNLEWYGSDFSGPSDYEQQTKNIVRVLDSLDADLYAFQEVNAQEDVNKITGNMKGYHGFIADHVSQSQKMAFIFNTNAIDSLDAGPISSSDVSQDYQRNWSYNWANGRTPLYFSFSYKNTSEEFYAIVIHAISNYGDDKDEDYRRRNKAAQALYHHLKNTKADANIILLGDYNDDVDQSIYEGKETPYYEFVNDESNFDVLSKKLSDSGQSASVNYEDIIDHITISNELFDNHLQNSTAVYEAPLSYIDSYGETTSDHLPVWAKFDVKSSSARVAP